MKQQLHSLAEVLFSHIYKDMHIHLYMHYKYMHMYYKLYKIINYKYMHINIYIAIYTQ